MAAGNGELQTVVNERVLVEWKDETDQVFTLGSISSRHKLEVKLALKIGLDTNMDNGHGLVEFSLVVGVRTAGRRRDKEFSIVIPLHTLFSPTSDPPVFSFKPVQVSKVAGPVISSALKNAGLSESGQIIRAHFRLHDGPVHVLMPRSVAKKIQPGSSTAHDLLQGFKSLAQVRTFFVYIKPSDYARQGLRVVAERLRSNPPVGDISLADLCDERDVEPVKWTVLGIDQEDDSCPPAYEIECERSPEPQPEVFSTHGVSYLRPSQPPSSPLSQRSTSVVPETPLSHSDEGKSDYNVPLKDSCTSRTVLLGAPTPVKPSLGNVQPAPLTLGKRAASELSPDQRGSRTDNQAAVMKRNRIEHLQPTAHSPPPLLHEMYRWLHHATLVNLYIHEHPRLQPYLHALGQYARTQNQDAFTAARASCAAIFAFDPFNEITDSVFPRDEQRQQLSAACAFFIADIKRLILWAFSLDPHADFVLQDSLLDLGKEARRAVGLAAAQPSDRHGATFATVEYQRQRAACVGSVFFNWGDTGEP